MKRQFILYLVIVVMLLTACKKQQNSGLVIENSTEATTEKTTVVYEDDYYVKMLNKDYKDEYVGNSFTKIIFDANQYKNLYDKIDNVEEKKIINNPYVPNVEYEYMRSQYTWTYQLLETERRILSHQYRYQNEDLTGMTVNIDDNGNLISYIRNFKSSGYVEDKKLTEEEAKKIAEAELRRVMGDEYFDTYELDKIEKDVTAAFGLYYFKKAYGYDTEQNVRVYIRRDGTIKSVYLEDYEKWHNIFKDTNLEQEKIDATADKLMNLIDEEVGLDKEFWKNPPSREKVRIHIDDSGNVYVYVIADTEENGRVRYYAIVRW